MLSEVTETPELLLKEGTFKSQGRNAQRENIMAPRIIAEPGGSSPISKVIDKRLVDSFGDGEF